MQQFERFFEQGPFRALVVAPERPFIIRAATDAYLEATFTARDIIGYPMFEVFPDNPQDPTATGVANLNASFEHTLATRAPDTMPVQKYDIRNGSRREFVERFWTPINATATENGRRIGIVHRVEDVTEFVRQGEVLRGEAAQLKHEILVRARELALVNGALRDTLEQRRRMTAIVSHDLRSPLSVIRMGVEVIRAHFRNLGTQPPHSVDILRSATVRMEQLLADLNDYTATQLHGALPVERQQVNVRELCEEIAAGAGLAHPTRVIVLEPGDAIGANVDPARIRQLLTNLIENALTYGAPDRPVLVSLKRITGGCVLSVSNHGDPIPPDAVPNLFKPFQRGPGTGTREQRGHMGLGLYIADQIVRAHGGRIDVDSTPRGTNFLVFLPID
jgi:signal transduction histidine kinase